MLLRCLFFFTTTKYLGPGFCGKCASTLPSQDRPPPGCLNPLQGASNLPSLWCAQCVQLSPFLPTLPAICASFSFSPLDPLSPPLHLFQAPLQRPFAEPFQQQALAAGCPCLPPPDTLGSYSSSALGLSLSLFPFVPHSLSHQAFNQSSNGWPHVSLPGFLPGIHALGGGVCLPFTCVCGLACHPCTPSSLPSTQLSLLRSLLARFSFSFYSISSHRLSSTILHCLPGVLLSFWQAAANYPPRPARGHSSYEADAICL